MAAMPLMRGRGSEAKTPDSAPRAHNSRCCSTNNSRSCQFFLEKPKQDEALLIRFDATRLSKVIPVTRQCNDYICDILIVTKHKPQSASPQQVSLRLHLASAPD